MKSLFGNINEKIEFISRENLNNNLTRTTFKIGKLLVVGTSNKPSCESIDIKRSIFWSLIFTTLLNNRAILLNNMLYYL